MEGQSNLKATTIETIINMVKNLIEGCIQLYMTRKETVNKLQNKATIDPRLTEIIWQRLEEQNPKFFKFYYTRLALKQQVEEFNKLLDKQKQLMDEEQAKVAPLPYSNMSHIPNIIENPPRYYVSAQTPEGLNPYNMQHGVESSLTNVFNNGGSSTNMFAHRDIPIPPYIHNSNGGSSFSMSDMSIMPYSQNSNLGLQQGIDGGMTISVPGCSSSSPHMFGFDGKISEPSPNVGNASSATPITSVKSMLHSANESVLDYPYTYLNKSLSGEFDLSNFPDDLFGEFDLSNFPDDLFDFSMDFDDEFANLSMDFDDQSFNLG